MTIGAIAGLVLIGTVMSALAASRRRSTAPVPVRVRTGKNPNRNPGHRR